MTNVQMKMTGFFKPDPQNPRKTADESELDRLGDDLLVRGVLVALLAKADGTLIDGWRRWLAAQRKGIKELPAIIVEKSMTDVETRGIQLATAIHRADLTAYEKWLSCKELMSLNPAWQMKDLAEFLHCDPSMLPRLLSPSKCITAWQEALKAGHVGISDVYAASKLQQSEQDVLLGMKLSGASRDQIEKAGRKARGGTQQAAKVSRIPIRLPGGVSIVISGADMSLDDAIEALTDVLKSARKSRDEGLTAKSFAAAMKDKAKAG